MTAFDPSPHSLSRDTPPRLPEAATFQEQLGAIVDYPVKGLLNAARSCGESPRRPKKEAAGVQVRLTRELLEQIPKDGELPIAREQLATVLRRITGRVAALGRGEDLAQPSERALLVRQVVAEAHIGRELGFTARELTMILHKVSLPDIIALGEGYPKYIIERAISSPNPISAAAELEKRRVDHERYIRGRLSDDSEGIGDIAPLIARKSFRLKVDPKHPFAQVDQLLTRYLSDRSWFQDNLGEGAQKFSRHLASRSFYLAHERRNSLMRELSTFERGLDEDPRVKQFQLKAALTLNLLGVVRDPLARATQLIDSFESEYQRCRRYLPGEPEAIYRGLALRAAFTVNGGSPQPLSLHQPSEVPKSLPALIERYQFFQERFASSPTLGRYLALEMTLSGDPEARLRDEIGRVRRSLGIEHETVPREQLLTALEAAFRDTPEERHTMYRKCLRGNPDKLPPSPEGEFAHFANKVKALLS